VPVLRVSWTAIRTHAECAAKSYLRSEGHRSLITDLRNYFHGTVIDIVQRRWLEQDSPEPGWMRGQVDAIFAEAEQSARTSGEGIVKWKRAGDKAETLEFCREAASRLEELLGRVCLPYDWQPALRFYTPVQIPGLDGSPSEVELTGEIDLLVDYPPGVMPWSGVVPWDLKATRDSQYWRKVKGQLVFYCIALAAMRGQWPQAAGLIQPMCDEPLPVWQFTEQDYREMFARITSFAHDRWAGRVQPKADNQGCAYCEVRGACPKFPKGRGRVSLGVPQETGSQVEGMS